MLAYQEKHELIPPDVQPVGRTLRWHENMGRQDVVVVRRYGTAGTADAIIDTGLSQRPLLSGKSAGTARSPATDRFLSVQVITDGS